MKKIFLLIAGTITLILGIIGIILPILPTTPFLLLSATCYCKSSKKLYTWLLEHKVLGIYIRSYILYSAITIQAKIISIIALWGVMSSTIIFFIDPTWLRILLIFIAVGVTTYILRIQTLTKDMVKI